MDRPAAEGASPEKPTGPSTRSIVLWGAGMLAVLGLVAPGAHVFLAVRDARKALAGFDVVEFSLWVGDTRDPGRKYKSISYRAGPSLASFVPAEDALVQPGPKTILGGEDAAVRKLRVYLALPKKLAPKRKEAIYVLSSCGPGAVPVLAGLLEDSDAGIRCIAAWALGEIGSNAASAVSALEKLLDDPDEDTRSAAEQAMSNIRR